MSTCPRAFHRHWLLYCLMFITCWSAPAKANTENTLRTFQRRAILSQIDGQWVTTLADHPLVMSLDAATMQVEMGHQTGAFDLAGNTLTMTFEDTTVTYNFKLVGDQLELSGGDLSGPVGFARQLEVMRYLSGVLDLSPESVWRRISRILFIIGVVVVATAVISLARWISRMLIFGRWGPFALIYRDRQNRAKTIHSLVLNVVKYFIYFTALGMILSEMGVNYATYIASLSVVGLAIGFGSQGLVQDMVTGFFIILENQFDVGDMIEVSGQTGVVTELGLRMTKLRNYLGQTVVVPNRNILLVGNYMRGAQRGYVDVSMADVATAERAKPILETLAREMSKQFEDVVLDPIRTSGPIALNTGEVFARLHLSVWPGQQAWVVDQQLVPRIREQIKKAGLEIVGDRVTVYYHPHEVVQVSRWRQHLSWARAQGKDPEPAPDPIPESATPAPQAEIDSVTR